MVGVPRPPSPALGEEHGRQPHPLDQLEQTVLLAVPDRPLGAGEDRVVVGEHGAGASLAEEVAVDAAGAGDEAVGRGALEQLGKLAAGPLGGDRQPAVLDEAARVDEVVDVLARGAPAGGMAALDGLGARLVAGQRPPLQRLGQVGPLLSRSALRGLRFGSISSHRRSLAYRRAPIALAA